MTRRTLTPALLIAAAALAAPASLGAQASPTTPQAAPATARRRPRRPSTNRGACSPPTSTR